jgi:hypothetical protein
MTIDDLDVVADVAGGRVAGDDGAADRGGEVCKRIGGADHGW